MLILDENEAPRQQWNDNLEPLHGQCLQTEVWDAHNDNATFGKETCLDQRSMGVLPNNPVKKHEQNVDMVRFFQPIAALQLSDRARP